MLWNVDERNRSILIHFFAKKGDLFFRNPKLNGVPLDTRCDCEQDYEIVWVEIERRFETTMRTKDTK